MHSQRIAGGRAVIQFVATSNVQIGAGFRSPYPPPLPRAPYASPLLAGTAAAFRMTTWKFVVTITASITLSLLDGCVVVASQEQLQPNIVFFMCAL